MLFWREKPNPKYPGRYADGVGRTSDPVKRQFFFCGASRRLLACGASSSIWALGARAPPAHAPDWPPNAVIPITYHAVPDIALLRIRAISTSSGLQPTGRWRKMLWT